MKSILTAPFLFSIFLAFGSQAMAAGYTSCSNGDISVIGDSYYQIDLLEDGIEFMPYEGAFTFDAGDIAYEAGTFSIVNKPVTISAEGEEFTSVVNAILTLNSKGTELNVAISHDSGAFASYTMNCVQVN
jgi:hypothetical protein